MRERNSAEKSARTREQLAQLHDQYVAAKTWATRNRLAWKLFRLILDPCASFDSLKASEMPRRKYTWYECAIIELFRLGYEFGSGAVSPAFGSDNVDDLLWIVGGVEEIDNLDPKLHEAVFWAIKNRRVGWGHQITIAECMGCSAALDRIMEQAGPLHIKAELTDESGRLKVPAWMKIPDVEKAAIDRELRTKVAAMTFEEQEARWIELKDAPDSYANLMEGLFIMLGDSGE